ncbi:MAG: VCBS repeat-containing protein [Deltaproteobacteria bacterium]|nr:VCBS repeat-containing protein [Deltaproteobacteria bacterium]MBK8241573.1 VCBS repeat-containing protein [Deltaproteobacteria bacterium]MBK8713940.1 VCBS repeat-containing protein [Deltaproteobacteria bacterium]MBP7289861.1 VCBS repeat-containing protein [Nannocystaceae bacterium]
MRAWLGVMVWTTAACGPWTPIDHGAIVVGGSSSGVASSSGDDAPSQQDCLALAACFERRIDLAVGLAPRDLAVGEIDGNGAPDLVVRGDAPVGSARVVVLQSRERFTILPAAVDAGLGAALVDVDRDGHHDLVSANGVVLELRSGASTLTSVVESAALPQAPVSLVVMPAGDDGESLYAVAELADPGGIATVRLAGGAFGEVVQLTAYGQSSDFSYASNGIDLGDVDADGRVDALAVIDMHGAGTFQAEVRVWPASQGHYGVQWFSGEGHHQGVGDVDADGHDDLLVLEFYGRLHRFAWTGPSSIADIDGWGAAAANVIEVGDVSGDGIADVVLARHGNDEDPRLDLLTDWDDGTPVIHELALDHEFDVLLLADVDGDHRDDIIGGSISRQSVTVLYAGMP